jgi:opacity protein-like surface antigen
MRHLALALALLVSVATAVPAQTLGVTVGGGRTWDDEGSVGNGGSIGASAWWPTAGRWAFGVDLERLSHDRTTSNGGLRFRGRTWILSGIAALRFGNGPARPYLFGGAGLLHYAGTFEDSTFQTRTARDSSSSTLAFGAGIDFEASRHVSIRPELRIYMAQPEDDFAPWSMIRGAVTVSWRRQS